MNSFHLLHKVNVQGRYNFYLSTLLHGLASEPLKVYGWNFVLEGSKSAAEVI
jgi:hypothetical protein